MFTPLNRAVTVNGANRPAQDFVATAAAATFSLSGTVTGPAGVSIALSGANTGTTNTAVVNGTYSFTGLANGSYTVTPSFPGRTFTPVNRAVTIASANSTANDFTASIPTFSISGAVSGAIANGVTINLAGAATNTTVTAAGGTYTFTGLADGSYTVTPVLAGYSFSPASGSVTISGANSASTNFTATALTYTISGTVSGSVTSGVTVNLTGTTTASTTTVAGGTYSFSGLTHGGNYTVTPSIANNTFAPTSINVNGIVANSTGNNFTASAVPTFSLSGTITGPYVEGVTVTLGNGASTTTATNGVYNFANLAAGTYTVTPALPGYVYTPAAPSVAVSANTTQDFTASSAVANHSISGTVSYNGTKTGLIYVRVASCAGCNAEAGTMISAPGPYTIRGLSPNRNYTVSAERDYLNNGAGNTTNPTGSTAATVATSDLTGINITMADPATVAPTAPLGLTVNPGDASAIIFWDQVRDTNFTERVTGYKVYTGTNTPPTGAVITVPAAGDNGTIAFQAGLTNNTQHFYQVTSLVGTTESAKSAVVGPITIGAGVGGNTVSGTVTFTGTATGSLVVGVFSETGGLFFTRIANPGSPQSYTITGVPAGLYGNFANIDMNNNGIPFDLGDITNTDGNTPNITVSGPTTGNLVLNSASATASMLTSVQFSGTATTGSYNLEAGVDGNLKRVTKVTLVSGKNMPVPLDMGRTNNSNFDFQRFEFLNTTVPAVGDSYVYKVTYSDSTTETFTRSVSAVYGVDNAPKNLVTVINGTGGSSATVPLFTWGAPTTPPGFFTYDIHMSGTNAFWNFPDSNSGLPSTTSPLQVLYNVDGRANPASLVIGTPYTWQVRVQDANGNSASRSQGYTP